MNREESILKLESQIMWDVIVIGGGATGLGVALDAATRGLSTLLLEQNDFAKGTSSRSTKLIHGGLRYLKQGHIGLVKEALIERGRLKQNAPELVQEIPFIIPFYSYWEGVVYQLGLKIYDFLAKNSGFSKSKKIQSDEVLYYLPTLNPQSLAGGIIYYDGQCDDAKLALSLALTCERHGGVLLNYFEVNALKKIDGKVCGIEAKDKESGKNYTINGRAIINATGIFCDNLRGLDQINCNPLVRASQGIHITLDHSFLKSKSALMIPKTSDNRVLFIIPWLDHVLVGTTDIEKEKIEHDPVALEKEISFLIQHANKYLTKKIERKDILSVFAGLRPLINVKATKKTSKIPREYLIEVSHSDFITITGGKWTTYRSMAEKVLDTAIRLKKMTPKKCVTHDLNLELPKRTSEKTLIDGLNITKSDIKQVIHYEMARTIEDVLARRTRCLFLDVRKTIAISKQVAEIMARELNHDEKWIKFQCEAFLILADKYLPKI